MSRTRFVRGDIVEVRSPAEIAATLDSDGRLDGIPFMPEMTGKCGHRFRVHRRAERTCVEGLGMRRLNNTVFLEDLRCDGAAHDGCQRGCLFFWKEAWLKPVAAQNGTTGPTAVANIDTVATLNGRLITRSGVRYVCQSTALATATSPLTIWSQFLLLREIADGELPPTRFIAIVVLAFLNKVRALAGLPALGALQGLKIRAPKGSLKLAPGERVYVKSEAEIAATLDPRGRNSGLSFEPDMASFVGKPFEVEAPVTRIIQEQTGRMTELTSTVTLKGVSCTGLCSKNCPRNNPIYWREIWLERKEDASTVEPAVLPAPATAA